MLQWHLFFSFKNASFSFQKLGLGPVIFIMCCWYIRDSLTSHSTLYSKAGLTLNASYRQVTSEDRIALKSCFWVASASDWWLWEIGCGTRLILTTFNWTSLCSHRKLWWNWELWGGLSRGRGGKKSEYDHISTEEKKNLRLYLGGSLYWTRPICLVNWLCWWGWL